METDKYFIKIYGFVYFCYLRLDEAKEYYRRLQDNEPKLTRKTRIIYKHQ